jgi:M6 family metalloprotease-like protein
MHLRAAAISVSLLMLGCASLAMAQEAESGAPLRSLNNAVLKHHDLVMLARPEQRGAIRTQAATDIARREAALAVLIETDPDAAIKLAFSSELIDELKTAFPASANHFEQQQTWSGVLESSVEDDLNLRSAKITHVLNSGGRTHKVYFSGPEPSVNRGQVFVSGIAALGNMAARSVSAATTVTPAGSGTVGPQNIVTILVNLPGYKLPANVTPDFMKGVLYGNASSMSQSTPNWYVDDFWQQNSDGQTSAPVTGGQIVGPFLLSSNFNTSSTGTAFCDYIDMKQAAINAADAAVNFLSFNRVVIVMPNNGACTWSGISSIGYWSATSQDGTFNASFHWLRGDLIPTRATGVQLATHELGHGFGLNHARSRAYPGPPAQALGANGAAGVLTEYGDPFATMAAWSFGFYSAQHAQEILGWLAPSNYSVVTASGQYAVNAYETRGASGLVKALKVLRDAASNSWLWIEYRTNTGIYDSQVPWQSRSGALIHYEDASTGVYTDLLDFTPATSTFTDAALAAGQTWVDPYSNLSVQVGAITGNTLNVSVNYGVAGCIPANPAVSLSPGNPTVSVGGSTSFTVTVKNQNPAVCPVSTYSLATAQPSGFAGKLSVASLTLAEGASGSLKLTDTAGTAIGTFPVSVTATDTGTPGASGTGTANITTASLCVAANPAVSLSPATVSLAAGASTAFTLTLRNNNSSPCAATSFNLTSIQPQGFSGAFSKTSLSGIASGASSSVTLTEKAGTAAGTFVLSVTGASATSPASAGTGTATMTVTAGCTLAAPAVSIAPTAVSLKAGASTALTITVRNTNPAACPAATFALAETRPTGFSGKLSVQSLTINSGASSTATLTETAGKSAGTFGIAISATNGSYTGSASTTAAVTLTPVIRRIRVPGL